MTTITEQLEGLLPADCVYTKDQRIIAEAVGELRELRGQIEQAWINGYDVARSLMTDAKLATLPATPTETGEAFWIDVATKHAEELLAGYYPKRLFVLGAASGIALAVAVGVVV